VGTVSLLALFLLCSLRVNAADDEVVSGRVYLDANGNGKFDSGEKGLAGIRITDSVNFVTTGEDGSYTITVADDPEIPYRPSRVVSVSWPGGKWPSGAWWRRLSEIKAGEKVDFGLRDEQQKMPFLFVHITDDHGSGGPYGSIGAVVKEQLMGMARFCINTGDLGYSSPDTADQMFGSIADKAKQFPVPMLFTPGNHDMTGRIPDWGKGPLYGTGGFTRYLGPIRWAFTYADSHFAGVDWADAKNGEHENTPEIAADWLERDLKDLKPGTRIFLFMHFPSACPRFVQVVSKYKVTYVFGGHNHTHREYDFGGVPAITSINLESRGAVLGIVQENAFNAVVYCGGCKGKPEYHSKKCGLKHFLTSLVAPIEQRSSLLPVILDRHGRHAGISDRKISSSSQALEAGQGPAHITAEIEPGTGKAGLKIGEKDSIEITYADRTLNAAGVPIPFALRSHEKALSWEILVENSTLTIYANNMIRLVKPVKVDNPAKVTAFADGGSATFKKVNVWSLGDPSRPDNAVKAK